jgi:hypothetical protein
MQDSTKNGKGDIKISASVLSRATQNDPEALATMFKQFIPEDEHIYYAQYLGLKGILGIGARSFACLTDRRVADISIGRFSELIYQDGYLEFINSGIIYQPSKLGLYILFGFWLLLTLIITNLIYSSLWWNSGGGLAFLASFIVFGLFLLLLPFVIKAYYGIVKCGIVFWVREGVPIYIFCNRKYLKRANLFCRNVTTSRESRLKETRKYAESL